MLGVMEVTPTIRIVDVAGVDIASKHLPAVCVMTGRPSETWRTFRFATLPVGSWVAQGVFSFRNERSLVGYLPLTRASDRILTLCTWLALSAIVLGVVLAAIAGLLMIPKSSSEAGGGVMLFGSLALICIGGIAVLVLRPFVGPQGEVRVVDVVSSRAQTVVRLRRVHPRFVQAVVASNANRR